MPNLIAREVKHLKGNVTSKLEKQVSSFVVQQRTCHQPAVKRLLQSFDRLERRGQAVLLLMIKAAYSCLAVVRRQYSASSRVPFSNDSTTEAIPGSGYPIPGITETVTSFKSAKDPSRFVATLKRLHYYGRFTP